MLSLSKSNLSLYNLIIIFLLFVSNFFYNSEIYDIQIKYIAYLFSILSFFRIFNVDKKFLYLLIFLSIFLTIHTFLVSHFNIKNSLSIIFFISVLLLVYLNFSFIQKYFFKINYYFFLFISLKLLILILFIVFKNKDLFFDIGYLTNNTCKGITINSLHFFFKEHSHIALVLPSLFFSFLYLNKSEIFKNLFMILYLFFNVLFFSVTMFIVNLIALVLITFYSFDLLKKNIFFFILLMSILIYPLIFNNKCLYKINDLKRSHLIYEKSLIFQEYETNQIINSNSKDVNVTAFVFINHFDLVKNALKSKYFGYGFNNYEELFIKNIEKQSLQLKDIYKDFINLNYNDASSNLLKILGEFGSLSILLIIIFIIFLFPNNIDNRIKVIISIVIIPQLIRGAGYFNFSFIIYSCLVFVYVFKLFLDKNIIK